MINAELRIKEDEAEVVRRIFDLCLQGYGKQSIANILNKENPDSSRKWYVYGIDYILNNERYMGDALLNKTYISDCISKKVKKNNGERPMYYVENNHPAIIDKDTFNRVQEEFARRTSKRKVKQVGTNNSSDTPIKIMEDVKTVELGFNYSAAITNDNSLYMWGCNSDGQLGDGTTEDSSSPIKILDNVVDICLGYAFCTAITENGDLYLWGCNTYYQIGDGTNNDSATPIKVMDNVVDVNLHQWCSSAITSNGDLYTWGTSEYRFRLGNGDATVQEMPTKIMSNVPVDN